MMTQTLLQEMSRAQIESLMAFHRSKQAHYIEVSNPLCWGLRWSEADDSYVPARVLNPEYRANDQAENLARAAEHGERWLAAFEARIGI